MAAVLLAVLAAGFSGCKPSAEQKAAADNQDHQGRRVYLIDRQRSLVWRDFA